MTKKALYAGSFDPLTLGHLDLIRRASRLCDVLVVGVIRNPGKNAMFTEKQRTDMIKAAVADIPNVEVDAFSGLLADYVNDNGFDMVVRGLRGTADFDSEIQMAQLHSILYRNGAETVFLMTSGKYGFISSSMAKEVYSLGGDISEMVPEVVLEMMDVFTERGDK